MSCKNCQGVDGELTRVPCTLLKIVGQPFSRIWKGFKEDGIESDISTWSFSLIIYKPIGIGNIEIPNASFVLDGTNAVVMTITDDDLAGLPVSSLTTFRLKVDTGTTDPSFWVEGTLSYQK